MWVAVLGIRHQKVTAQLDLLAQLEGGEAAVGAAGAAEGVTQGALRAGSQAQSWVIGSTALKTARGVQDVQLHMMFSYAVCSATLGVQLQPHRM